MAWEPASPRVFNVGDIVTVVPEAEWKVCRDCFRHAGGIYFCAKHAAVDAIVVEDHAP